MEEQIKPTISSVIACNGCGFKRTLGKQGKANLETQFGSLEAAKEKYKCRKCKKADKLATKDKGC